MAQTLEASSESSERRMLVERALPCDGRDRRGTRSSRRVTVNLAESPLGWLRARSLITERQFHAGEALRADYERAALGPSITMQWDGAPRGKRAAPAATATATTAQLNAKRRFDDAIAHAGPSLADILWRVVCACDAVPVAEKALGWPARSGRLVLTIALDRLADFYRL